MTITLSAFDSIGLAEAFARDIHGLVVSRNLRLIGELLNSASGDREAISRIRLAIHSISDLSDRKDFVCHIRHYFWKIRAAKSTCVRGSDYVASVRAYETRQHNF